MTPHELTIKGIGACLATITGTLSAMFGGGILANATGDTTLFGINLTTLEKIGLITGLMIVAIVLGYVANKLFTRLDAIQTLRIDDQKKFAEDSHKVIQANTVALQENATAMRTLATSQAQLTEAVKELPRQPRHD